MANWSLPDKLQPSLLDRLTDRQPDKKKESSLQQVLSQSQYRDAVIRDLGWLLNSISLDSVVDLSAYPLAAKSVVNFGLPDISGHNSSSIDTESLEKALKKVIEQYEPRIIRNTLKISVQSNPEDMSHNSLVFEIEGVVFGQPMPFQVILRSELDLENGTFEVSEATA